MYDQAIHLKPNYAIAYNNRGLAKNNLELYDAAIADYNCAINLKHDFAEAHNNRGLALCNLGQYDAAIVDYDRAIDLYNRIMRLPTTTGDLPEEPAGPIFRNTAIALKDYDTGQSDSNRILRKLITIVVFPKLCKSKAKMLQLSLRYSQCNSVQR